MIAVRFYRIYDIGKELDLTWLERELAQRFVTTRTRFQRVQPKSIAIEEPPLLIRLDPLRIERDGKSFDFQVFARIYDIGVISLCLVCEKAEADYQVLEETAILFSEQKGLTEYFLRYLNHLTELVKPHIRNFAIEPEFYEDYTIYLSDKKDESFDPVLLLIGERVSLSAQMREEITRNSLSYTTADLAILSWDSALLCGPETPTDLIDLIEYSNVQVFELRYYDRELTHQMEKMYDDIEHAERMWRLGRVRRYKAIMTDLMATYAEISEVIEKVDNLIKVTEDVYYARVYATALKVLRSRQWSESVSRKIEVFQENYSMLSAEVRIQHSNFLEWVVIVLIALEFGFFIWESLH
ncbi:MAG: hypothetical protein LUO93_03210 [Methanomicrobiales archaeon]|nr:hypothetical protein [Methanomicrobiales archaeon]